MSLIKRSTNLSKRSKGFILGLSKVLSPFQKYHLIQLKRMYKDNIMAKLYCNGEYVEFTAIINHSKYKAWKQRYYKDHASNRVYYA